MGFYMNKIPIGLNLKHGTIQKFTLHRNLTSTPNKNILLLAQQGSGKTNLLMLNIYMMYKTYLETGSDFGCLPIIFTPTYEFLKMSRPSKNVNMPPELVPEGINASHITFECCEPIDSELLEIVSFKFNDLTVEDICAFAGLANDSSIFGAVQKIKERIEYGWIEKIKVEEEYSTKNGEIKTKMVSKEIEHPPNPDYNVDDFIEMVVSENSLKNALYYVYTKLKKLGMFNEDKIFDLRELIKRQKPIIFHFGDLDDKNIMSSLAGIIMRKLWEIGQEYYNATLKTRKDVFTDWEMFLLKNFTIGLFMEEAHQILYATRSGGMAIESNHPAHAWFKKITTLMGRKRGFKYSFIITQAFMEIFYGVRKKFTFLMIGDSIFPDDINFIESDLKVNPKHLIKMTRLPKFSWTILDIEKYGKRKAGCASKFRSYLSPCGID